jgi:hypothetical protein
VASNRKDCSHHHSFDHNTFAAFGAPVVVGIVDYAAGVAAVETEKDKGCPRHRVFQPLPTLELRASAFD